MTRKAFFSLSTLFIAGIVSLATSQPMWSVDESVNYFEKIILSPDSNTHEIEVLLSVEPAMYQERLELSFSFSGTHNGDSSGVFRTTQLDDSGQPTDIYVESIISGGVNGTEAEISPYATFHGLTDQPTKYQLHWDGEGTIDLDLSIHGSIIGTGEMPEEEIIINIEVIP